MKKILIACLIGFMASFTFANQMDFVVRTTDMEYRFDYEDLDKIRDIQYYDDQVRIVFDTDEWAEMVAKNTGLCSREKQFCLQK